MGVPYKELLTGTFTVLTDHTSPALAAGEVMSVSTLQRNLFCARGGDLLHVSGSSCMSLNPPAEVPVALGSSLPAAMALLMRISCLRGQRRMPLRRQARFSVVGQMPSCSATQSLGQKLTASAGSTIVT